MVKGIPKTIGALERKALSDKVPVEELRAEWIVHRTKYIMLHGRVPTVKELPAYKDPRFALHWPMFLLSHMPGFKRSGYARAACIKLSSSNE